MIFINESQLENAVALRKGSVVVSSGGNKKLFALFGRVYKIKGGISSSQMTEYLRKRKLWVLAKMFLVFVRYAKRDVISDKYL